MISLRKIGGFPASLPFISDDIVEFHAARLILLIHICGKGQIEGLTKLAKLDFFVRYPGFFAQAATSIGKPVEIENDSIESEMVRHHYGPWDKRYYQIIAYLESRGIINVRKDKKTYIFSLSQAGETAAKALILNEAFSPLCNQMATVRKVFGVKTGSFLKNLIYKVFDEEVTKRPLGEVINDDK